MESKVGDDPRLETQKKKGVKPINDKRRRVQRIGFTRRAENTGLHSGRERGVRGERGEREGRERGEKGGRKQGERSAASGGNVPNEY